MDLFVQSIDGQIEMLTDVEVTRKDTVNGEKYISVTVVKTSKNKHAIPLVKNENIFVYDNEEYIIKQKDEVPQSIAIMAKHRMFDDLLNHYIYETITGTKRLNDLVSFALNGSGYTYTLLTDGLPLSVIVENFGNDNSAALLKSILDKFKAEFEINDKNITIKYKKGTSTDSQFRFKHNIADPSVSINTGNFATYIKGFGKINEDGSYMVTTEYTSPLAEIYGIKHAQPIRDERYTNEAELLEGCKNQINDNIDMSIKLNYIQLKQYGIEDIQLGDYVWCILDPFDDVEVKIRVIEKEDYSNSNKAPVFTLGTVTKKATDIIASFNTTKSRVDKLLTEGGIVKYQFLDTAVKEATEAIQSTVTELEYTSNGIVARDKKNSNNVVVLNSAGVGVSTDGGQTFNTAMTAEAIVSFRVIGSDIEGGTIKGASISSVDTSTGDSTMITGGKVEATGSFSRDFESGKTATYVSTFDSYNGAVRIGIHSKKGSDGIERVHTGGRALIYTDKTVSSQRNIHAASEDKKGARYIDFFADETLTSDVQGLGMEIYSGQGMKIESVDDLIINGAKIKLNNVDILQKIQDMEQKIATLEKKDT